MKKLGKITGKIARSKLIWIPVAVLIALVLYRFKGYFVAATVNGQPITRVAVLTQLEKEGGKSILDNLVTNELVLQEAKKENVTATPQEISDQINQIDANIKASGQTLDSALAAQGMTKSDLNDQIKLQILVQKMAGKDINITDQDALDYFNANVSTYPKGTKFETEKEQIKTDLKQQKLSTAISSWIANLKAKAKVQYFVNY